MPTLIYPGKDGWDYRVKKLLGITGWRVIRVNAGAGVLTGGGAFKRPAQIDLEDMGGQSGDGTIIWLGHGAYYTNKAHAYTSSRCLLMRCLSAKEAKLYGVSVPILQIRVDTLAEVIAGVCQGLNIVPTALIVHSCCAGLNKSGTCTAEPLGGGQPLAKTLGQKVKELLTQNVQGYGGDTLEVRAPFRPVQVMSVMALIEGAKANPLTAYSKEYAEAL